jgi:hypothetical protein
MLALQPRRLPTSFLNSNKGIVASVFECFALFLLTKLMIYFIHETTNQPCFIKFIAFRGIHFRHLAIIHMLHTRAHVCTLAGGGIKTA